MIHFNGSAWKDGRVGGGEEWEVRFLSPRSAPCSTNVSCPCSPPTSTSCPPLSAPSVKLKHHVPTYLYITSSPPRSPDAHLYLSYWVLELVHAKPTCPVFVITDSFTDSEAREAVFAPLARAEIPVTFVQVDEIYEVMQDVLIGTAWFDDQDHILCQHLSPSRGRRSQGG